MHRFVKKKFVNLFGSVERTEPAFRGAGGPGGAARGRGGRGRAARGRTQHL
jgi:hypothetical protein